MFTKTTANVKVTAVPRFMPEHSEPDEAHYVWAYTIELENHNKVPVKLISRYWNITDAQGLIQEVRGAGVVGEQPVLQPGEAYRYTSGTSLHTPSGVMMGTYQMVASNGEKFDIDIPAFSLDSPFVTALAN